MTICIARLLKHAWWITQSTDSNNITNAPLELASSRFFSNTNPQAKKFRQLAVIRCFWQIIANTWKPTQMMLLNETRYRIAINYLNNQNTIGTGIQYHPSKPGWNANRAVLTWNNKWCWNPQHGGNLFLRKLQRTNRKASGSSKYHQFSSTVSGKIPAFVSCWYSPEVWAV